MINDCHTLAADWLTVVTVMTLFNHLWFLFSPENSVCKILLKFWQSDRKIRIAGANLILTTPRSSLITDPARKCRDWLLPRPTGPPPSFSPAGMTISLHLTQVPQGQPVSPDHLPSPDTRQPVSLGFSPGTATMRWLSTLWTGAAPPSNRFDLHEQDIANGSIIQDIVNYPRYCRLSNI